MVNTATDANDPERHRPMAELAQSGLVSLCSLRSLKELQDGEPSTSDLSTVNSPVLITQAQPHRKHVTKMLPRYSASVFDACKVSDRLFVLNPFYKRANFYSQQLRVLSLIREMFDQSTLSGTATELAIVGGGVSGLTAAAAALTGGANVTVIEKSGYLTQYASATHRELHPNLLSWPFQELRSITKLPFLNWSCSKAPTASQQIVDQWNEDFAHHIRSIKDTVTAVRATANAIEIDCLKEGRLIADVALIATGFAREDKLEGIPTPSYWTPQEFEPPGNVAISGSGDGGLIECASQVFGRKAVAAARALAYALNKQSRKDQILQAERSSLAHYSNGSGPTAFADLERFYRKLTIADAERELLESFRRAYPLKAIMYHRDQGAFSPTAAPANKLLVSTLVKGPVVDLETRQGEVCCNEPLKPSASFNGIDEAIDPFRLVVRHGAERAALSLLGDAEVEKLRAANQEHLNEIVPDEYDREFYVEKPARKIAPTPAHNQEHFWERAYRLIFELTDNACDRMWECSIERVQGEPWKIHVPRNLFVILEPLFPIVYESAEVALAQTSPRVFHIDR